MRAIARTLGSRRTPTIGMLLLAIVAAGPAFATGVPECEVGPDPSVNCDAKRPDTLGASLGGFGVAVNGPLNTVVGPTDCEASASLIVDAGGGVAAAAVSHCTLDSIVHIDAITVNLYRGGVVAATRTCRNDAGVQLGVFWCATSGVEASPGDLLRVESSHSWDRQLVDPLGGWVAWDSARCTVRQPRYLSCTARVPSTLV